MTVIKQYLAPDPNCALCDPRQQSGKRQGCHLSRKSTEFSEFKFALQSAVEEKQDLHFNPGQCAFGREIRRMEASRNFESGVVDGVSLAEELPNGDDSAFDEQQAVVQNADGLITVPSQGLTVADTNGITPEQVYVATSEGLITADQLQQAGIKTTHIVIHDQTLSVTDPGLKTPTTPLPPPTPSTPTSREKGYKYQWDSKVHLDVLPVRCKSSNGELHKEKFGSGLCVSFV